MSAPKSAAKRQKLEKKRQRKQDARLRRQRKQRNSPSELSSGSVVLQSGVPGGIRMSEILEEFLEPYAEMAESFAAYQRLLSVGMVAWNAALRPEHEREAMIEDCLRAAVPAGDGEAWAVARTIIDNLVARKHKYFSQYRRPILNFKLIDEGDDQWHLTVMSVVV